MIIPLEPKANVCLICFKEICDHTLFNLLNKNNVICEECFSKLEPKYIEFEVSNVKATALYIYNQEMKEIIYKFKGCYDIEMGEVFLNRYLWYLKLRYKGFYIVPLPSNELDDKRRGFNHVEEIYNRLNLPILNVIKKIVDSKQAKKSKKERLKTIEVFDVVDIERVKNKKILIVDDVFTTGSSVRAAITLVKRGKPKYIEVFVIAKSILKKKKTEY